ncbi:MAG: type II secretion system F family protein [Xanthobacteraceae bacterium]|nr:type II secretion system F family protein [Xanthobacteraceae bacterium]
MNGTYDVLIGVFGDRASSMMALLVFLAVAVAAFGIMAAVHARSSVKRRAAGIPVYSGERQTAEKHSLRGSSVRAVQRLLDYTNKHYSADQAGDAKVLRRRLIQAGIFDSRAVAFFFIGRTVLAVGLGVGAFMLLPMFATLKPSIFWMSVIVAGIIGYVGPSVYVDRRIARNKDEHRSGFPDFLDLMVVCADSGLSMEAALERVGRELGDSYPSLCANIHMTNLEIRAGKTMTDALEHFGDRLGLEEARAFATLIQQSAELGSSITEALRVYSDDMRHKRLSRAEEKAYSLPAKLSLPMMLCIFPVIFVVILLPVVVRLYTGNY